MKAKTFEQLGSEAGSVTASALSGLSNGRNFMDRFYLTGYEGLCLRLDHEELTRSMISSAVPMCGGLLVIGEAAEVEAWSAICDNLHISMTSIVVKDHDASGAVDALLKEDASISHILCSACYGDSAIKSLCQVAHRHRCAVIVDEASRDVDLKDIEDKGIDFSISTAETEQPVSIVIARRSRLVMTEGNARRGVHDIYAVWQDSLADRDARFAPMA